MARVAYLTGRTYRGTPLGPGAVPQLEEKSRDLILAAGKKRGVEFEIVYWDELDLPQRGFDLAVIRTTWDYTERADQFLRALESHERNGLRVCNPSQVVRWNMRKTYLQELGPSAIETVWTDKPDAHTVSQAFDALDAAEVVLKPQVGAGSVRTVRLRRNAWSEADLIDGPIGPAMIQPYLRAIETEGERSLFWFGGEYSHAVRKVPAAGDWLANVSGARFVAETPPPAAIEAAEAARARAPQDLLYVRIDLVLGDDGAWRVIEIEAIEPYLFLDFAPEGADVFVGAIARVLGA
ncbi:MAG: transporter [Alphaproteobacteria bacterium]|nr:transporter [Alphaproteobacteria bacterium]